MAVCIQVGNSEQVIWGFYYHLTKQFVGKLQLLNVFFHNVYCMFVFICSFHLVDELCIDSKYFVICIAAGLIFHSNYRKQYGEKGVSTECFM